jgi:hypothetical protein
MMRRGLLLTALALLVCAAPAFAQSSGQVWIRAFIDSDADGARSASDALLRRGIVVELLQDGVIIRTALLDESEFADQGLVGFRGLPAGTYGVRVYSALGDFTGESSAVLTIGGGGLPPIIEFGIAPPAAGAPAAAVGLLANFTPRDPETARLALSALGGLIVAGVFGAIGFALWLVLRAGAPRDVRITGTGTTRTVHPPVPDGGVDHPAEADDDASARS